MSKNFYEFVKEPPCRNCTAPCCRMLLISYPAPTTFMEMDYIRFMLGFPRIKLLLRNDGAWQVKVEQQCGFLDATTNLCKVHGTPQQPQTCVYYNPFHCWYKRNFTEEQPVELLEMDLAGYELLLRELQFDDEGKLKQIPPWEFINNLLKDANIQSNGADSYASREAPVTPLVPITPRWSVAK